MTRRAWVVVLCALLPALLPGCGRSRPENAILVATEAGYPPFEYVDEQGQIVGFDIELLRAIGREAGLEVEFRNQPFEGIIPGLNGRKYDAAISAMTITPERAEQVLFSDPYYDAGQIITVRSTETGIRGRSDLQGKVIAVQLNTTGHAQARRIPGATVKTFKSIEPAFLELLSGRADAVVNDFPTTHLILNRKQGLKTVGEPFTEERYGIAVRKGNEALLARINEGLRRVRASGEYARIEARWMAETAGSRQ